MTDDDRAKLEPESATGFHRTMPKRASLTTPIQKHPRLRRALLAVAATLIVAASASCAQILGLGDYTNECDAVKEGKACPDAGLCMPGEKTDCYSADPATEGKGICHGGTKTCGSDGLFGACEGEVTPAAKETCGNGVDDDCNGMVDDQCPCTPGKKYTCFSGNKAMQDVGDCKSGMAVCQSDGMTLGACSGDVLPKEEDYTKKGDENCDGSPSADTLWVQVLSTTGMPTSSSITGVATDAAGATYIAGMVQGTVLFGTTMISDASYVAKLIETDVGLGEAVPRERGASNRCRP